MYGASLLRRDPLAVLSLSLFLISPLASEAPAEVPVGPVDEAAALEVIDKYCIACHGPDKQQSGVRFHALETTDTVDQRTLFLKAQEAVHLETMPPEEAKQPTAAERQRLLAWLGSKLTGEDADKLVEKLARPESGNYVAHDDLFSGKYADLPGYTPDRRWLISQYIFDAKMNRLLHHRPVVTIDGQRQYVIGSNNRRVNLTNPFLLPNRSGVRYYANETLNGGHLLTMLTNAKVAADSMLSLAQRDRGYLSAVTALLELENQHEATLASRKGFLDIHIERVLKDVFRDRHDALLPMFVRVEVPEPIANDGAMKKAPFHAANPGRQELELIFRSMRRQRRAGQTDAQLIEACEREWFYHGHDPRQIQTRITFLNNYLDEWRKQIEQHRYEQRHPAIEYRPLPAAEMEEIAEALFRRRQPGDHFNAIIAKCLAHWEAEFKQQRVAAGPPRAEHIEALVSQLFLKILQREPDLDEAKQYAALTTDYMDSLGRRPAIKKLMQTLILRTEFVYRHEFGLGEPDAHGRRMMSPRDASYALAYALTDSSPDAELAAAAEHGRLHSREDYEREVRRMLARRDQYYIIDEAVHRPNDLSSFTNMPIRELRFFREFFGYPKLLAIFKDNKRFGAPYENAKTRLVSETDRLVEFILERDQHVFEQLLTTDEFYVFHTGDNASMKASSARIRKIYDYFKDRGWEEFTLADLAKHKDFIAEVKMRGIDPARLEKDRRYNPLGAFKKQMESFTVRLGQGQAAAAPYNAFPAHGMANAPSRYGGRMQSPEVAKFFNVDLADWDYPTTQPARMPHRKGMLTHPAWLIAFAQNTETDPIRRGKWIREKLLAGTIPDVPITVDAVIPEDPHRTLRQRLVGKTGNTYCATCHQKMEPLGLPFEIYDDFGRYRREERLEYPENLIEKVKDKGAPHEDVRDIYKTLPVDPRGFLEGTGDAALDGEVEDALDLMDRLAKSQRVRQSIIRHAFRYFMGRNEMLSDSKTLIEADQAYLTSGGSFDEVIVSLLTSDSFIYRKTPEGGN